MTLKRGESDAENKTMRNRIVLAAAASGLALAAVVGVAMGVGQDEPRLVRTAGTSAPLVESSTTSTSTVPAAGTAKVAELDATVENHEARIRVLESTTTTAPATPATSSPVAPAVEAQPTTTTTIVSTTTTQAAPTTTTTFYGEPWWCSVPSDSGVGGRKVPCDSTTTTTAG